MRLPRILAVDIGAGHVAAGVFSINATGRLVLQHFTRESHRSGSPHEGRWAAEVAQSLRSMAARHRFAGACTITVPGHLAFTKFVKTPSVAKERRSAIVAFEAGENIPHSLDEVVWDHLILSDDGLDLELMLAAAKSDALHSLCSAAVAAGLSVGRATPAGVALYQGFRYNYPHVRESIAVADIGARTTSLLFVEGERFFLRTLALGGNIVTQAVADELRIDFSSAETLKIQVLSGVSELPANAPSRAAVQRAAENFTRRLQLEFTRSAVSHRRQSGGMAPAILLLTGGGSLAEDLPATLAAGLHLRVERYEALRNVDLAADARIAGAEQFAPFLANVVGLATQLVARNAPAITLLPQSLRAALTFRKRQPLLIAAALLVVAALIPPMVYLHHAAAGTQEEIATLDDQLRPLYALRNRNEENLARLEQARKQIAALRTAYETKANWINFFADLQERLATIEDVWLDRLAVVRPPVRDSASSMVAPAFAENAAAAQQHASPDTPGSMERDVTGTLPPRTPVRMSLSGRLLDIAHPQSKVSPQSVERVKQLLTTFSGSQFVTAVENERFDPSQNGLLRFDCTLVIDPGKSL